MSRGDLLGRLGIEILWMDSMGAKSFSISIRSTHGYIVIDPGAAIMQPKYPLPLVEKLLLRKRAMEKIARRAVEASIIVITHYHYDHHVLPLDPDLGGLDIYRGKTLYIKDPNSYINRSQWDRARLFLEILLQLEGHTLEEYLVEPRTTYFPDPVEELVYIHSRDYGSYSSRRKELLEKGKRWFQKLVDLWSNGKWVKEIDTGNTSIRWLDRRTIEAGDTVIEPAGIWFHGIEYDRAGWVIPLKIRKSNRRIFYSSDLMGVIIEDYAVEITRFKPDIIILDGPPTYLYPYMFNRINLTRSIENIKTIIDNVNPQLLIIDHHLLRDRLWRRRFREALDYAEKKGVKLLTAAEYQGSKPLIDILHHSGK